MRSSTGKGGEKSSSLLRRHPSQTQSLVRVEICQTFLRRGAALMSTIPNSYPTSLGNVPSSHTTPSATNSCTRLSDARTRKVVPSPP